jgi:hypothetical protein
MMVTPRKIPLVTQPENQTRSSRIDLLKVMIRSEDYLSEAIQSMAQAMTNELLGIPRGGMVYEQQRKGRK